MNVYDEKIIKSIANDFFESGIIKKGDEILLALSGGVDSMCLLDAFYKLEPEFSFKLKAVHIHHGIRGKEADRDKEFVERCCKSLDIVCFVKKVKAIEYANEKGLTIEEAARILRYKELDEIWKKELTKNPDNNVFIATAHHMNDQVETIIHNMARGTGIKGLVGMKKVSGHIIRPLLNTSKEEIRNYEKCNAITYVNDSTNDDINYTRNYLRKEVISKLVMINDKAIKHISEISSDAYEMTEYIEFLSNKVLYDILIVEDKTDKVVIKNDLFRDTSHIIKVYIIRAILNKLTGSLKDIGRTHIEDIIDISSKDKGGHLDLPYNIVLDKKQKFLSFERKKINHSMSRRIKK